MRALYGCPGLHWLSAACSGDLLGGGQAASLCQRAAPVVAAYLAAARPFDILVRLSVTSRTCSTRLGLSMIHSQFRVELIIRVVVPQPLSNSLLSCLCTPWIVQGRNKRKKGRCSTTTLLTPNFPQGIVLACRESGSSFRLPRHAQVDFWVDVQVLSNAKHSPLLDFCKEASHTPASV